MSPSLAKMFALSQLGLGRSPWLSIRIAISIALCWAGLARAQSAPTRCETIPEKQYLLVLSNWSTASLRQLVSVSPDCRATYFAPLPQLAPLAKQPLGGQLELGLQVHSAELTAAQWEAISESLPNTSLPNTKPLEIISVLFDHSPLPKPIAALGAVPFPFGVRPADPEQAAGRSVAFQPGFDDQRLIPTTLKAPATTSLDALRDSLALSRHGDIALIHLTGPMKRAEVQLLCNRLEQLKQEGFQSHRISDLRRWLGSGVQPQAAHSIVANRLERIEQHKPFRTFRQPSSTADWNRWLTYMKCLGFTLTEMSAATGATTESIAERLNRLEAVAVPQFEQPDQVAVLPYPGGRHPRIGFRDGEVRPQRETKLALFPPWSRTDYVIADVPEAIWFEASSGRALLYLAHSHVPTIWDRQRMELEALEWQVDGIELSCTRRLPNGVSFTTRIVPLGKSAVELRMSLSNGSDQELTGLSVQNCVMLRNAPGFAYQTNDNKVFRPPFAATREQGTNRWVITAWQHCQRTWGNALCPCMHSDPRFPDCPPNESRELKGYIGFYEGNTLTSHLAELSRQWQLGPRP